MIRPGLALLLAVLALPATAEVFKWTDAKGKVHYGDQPPSGADFKPINTHVSKEAEARAAEIRRRAEEQAVRKRLEQAKAREAAGLQQATDEDEVKRRAANCQRARGNLEMLQNANMRLTIMDAQGQPVVMDAAAREAELAHARKTIADYCTNP